MISSGQNRFTNILPISGHCDTWWNAFNTEINVFPLARQINFCKRGDNMLAIIFVDDELGKYYISISISNSISIS